MSPQEPRPSDIEARLNAVTDALARMVGRQERIEARLDRIEDLLGVARAKQPVEAVVAEAQVDPLDAAPEGEHPSAHIPEPAASPVLPPPLPEYVLKPEPEPALETRFGLNWVNRVAVITLVIGVAFFFKYAADNQWIGAGMRVALGVAAGMAALSAGEWMSLHGQRIFARGMTGLGLGLLYLSFYASYGFYDILTLTTAFLLMTATTVAAGGLAFHYDSSAVSVLGLIGGFLTPVVLSSGENRLGTLAAYSLLLSLGALVLGKVRRWPSLGYLALVATQFLYAFWANRWLDDGTRWNAFTWLTLVFVLFLAFARDFDLALLPLNALVYFATYYGTLNGDYHEYMGSLTAALAVIHAVYGFLFAKDSLRPVALATAAVLLTFAVPIQFSGYRITIAWAAEAAACAWLARKLADIRLEFCSEILLILVAFRLLARDASIVADTFWNIRLLTFVIGSVAFWLGSVFLHSKQAKAVLYCSGHIVLLWGLALEIAGWAQRNADDVPSASATGISVLLTLWAIGLITVGTIKRAAIHRLLGLGLIGVVIAKLYLIDVWQLSRVFRIIAFLGLGAMLLLVSYLYSRFRPVVERLWRDSAEERQPKPDAVPEPPQGTV